MVSPEILNKAAASFAFDRNSIEFISNSTNNVFRFTKNNEVLFLRITEKSHDYINKVNAEVDWISYLVNNGVHASLPIKTLDNELTAVYEENGKGFIATAFQCAPGQFFNKNDPKLWGTFIFRQWGETMGKMHMLSKSYRPLKTRRDEWRSSEIANPYLLHSEYNVLLERLKSHESRIMKLPRDGNSYWLIHNDFHPYNFHINDKSITVFDFDDSIYGWFSLDIAIAATHAVWWGAQKDDRQSKNEFANKFLHEFLEGYFKYNLLDEYWIKQIPLYMDYRNICSYFWWLGSWDGDESRLNDFQREVITNAVKIIENGLSFDGCEIVLNYHERTN
ncbi:phosphotransferase enzyme family protein [Paenibacillus lignilyticus]|uniref:Phosphotransferase n=1 Tax=Paenibacillus lignilyticus TaxID=1172615 RepID=A0ABS5CN86_9BACL|nr:phosphotransferase [Paenibacillus lignilyticus]MBP3967325.1 phosphotransferase [Paenibacillus lignilyticus]